MAKDGGVVRYTGKKRGVVQYTGEGGKGCGLVHKAGGERGLVFLG